MPSNEEPEPQNRKGVGASSFGVRVKIQKIGD
jgi:hypothetical protein